MHELPDDSVGDILAVAKKVAIATGAAEYNVLQNNGRLAHQVCTLSASNFARLWIMFIVCTTSLRLVHVIPKPSQEKGLGGGWPSTQPPKEELQKVRILVSHIQVHEKLMSQLPK